MFWRKKPKGFLFRDKDRCRETFVELDKISLIEVEGRNYSITLDNGMILAFVKEEITSGETKDFVDINNEDKSHAT